MSINRTLFQYSSATVTIKIWTVCYFIIQWIKTLHITLIKSRRFITHTHTYVYICIISPLLSLIYLPLAPSLFTPPCCLTSAISNSSFCLKRAVYDLYIVCRVNEHIVHKVLLYMIYISVKISASVCCDSLIQLSLLFIYGSFLLTTIIIKEKQYFDMCVVGFGL